MPPVDFSIVVPSYNQGKYVAKTLESLLSQEGVTLQVIVRDGGSTDETLEIMESFSGRIEWLSQPDRGQAHAINEGMKTAAGHWLAYLNSDDVLLPGALQKVKAAFLENPGWDFVYGLAYRIDDKDRPLAHYPVKPWDAELMKETCFISQPACFWRREAGEKLGGFDEKLRFSLDYDFWLRGMGAKMKFGFLAEPLAAARIHRDAKTMDQRPQSFEESFATMRRHYPGHISRRWILALAQVRAEKHLYGSLHRPLAWARFVGDYWKNARELAREFDFRAPLGLAASTLPKCINSKKRVQVL